MKTQAKIFFLSLFLAASVNAQTIVLDNFNSGTVSGGIVASSNWVGNVSQNASTITIGGSALDISGWTDTGLTLDLSAMNYIFITGQRDTNHNPATNFVVEFFDETLASQQFSVSTSTFLVGSLSLVQISIGSWSIDATKITDWTIGGGSTPTLAFRMTLDELSVSSNPAPIPEASTYAAVFGVMALGFVAYRRRLGARA